MGCGSSSLGTVDVENPQVSEEDGDFKKKRVLEWLESANASNDEQHDTPSALKPMVPLDRNVSVLTQDEEKKFKIQSRLQRIPIDASELQGNDTNGQGEADEMVDEEECMSEASLGESEKGSRTGEKKHRRRSSSSEINSARKILYMKVDSRPSLQHAFFEFDKNNDKLISFHEFQERCNAYGINLDRHDLKQIFRSLDTNEDGFIQRDEFMKGFSTTKVRTILGLPAKQDADDIMHYSKEGIKAKRIGWNHTE
mmetsp:Transcript_30450/g.98118  ORF Transcript_30450/g.98118 Transcript_30450/m.98118 type:complete len:254 (+) Transcript_30450:257-1018(+)